MLSWTYLNHVIVAKDHNYRNSQVTSLGYGLKKAISTENKRPCLLVRKFYLLKEEFLKKNWQTMMSVERELKQIDFISGLRMTALGKVFSEFHNAL